VMLLLLLLLLLPAVPVLTCLMLISRRPSR